MLPDEFAISRLTSPLVVIRLLLPTALAVSVELPAVTQVPLSIVILELATMIFVNPLRTLIEPPNVLPVLLRLVPKLLLELNVDVPPTKRTPEGPWLMLPVFALAVNVPVVMVPLIKISAAVLRVAVV